MGDFNPLKAATGGLGQGFSGKGSGGPSAPDFSAVANQQTQQNRPNQNGPFSSSQWSQGPDGKYTQNIGLNGALGGAAAGLQNQFAQANSSPLDNGNQAREAASSAIYGQEASRLDPQWQQRQHDFQTQLANQGIDPNSAAYQTAQGNFDRGRNDAYQQANYGAIQGGTQAAMQQQQLDMNSRFAPLQEMQGLQGLTQQPGFAQSQLLPAAIAQFQGALQKYGIDQQGKNSTMGGLSNIGSAAIMA